LSFILSTPTENNVKYCITHRYESSQNQLRAVVTNYQEYKNTNQIREYLRAVAFHVKIGAVEQVDENDEDGLE